MEPFLVSSAHRNSPLLSSAALAVPTALLAPTTPCSALPGISVYARLSFLEGRRCMMSLFLIPPSAYQYVLDKVVHIS